MFLKRAFASPRSELRSVGRLTAVREYVHCGTVCRDLSVATRNHNTSDGESGWSVRDIFQGISLC